MGEGLGARRKVWEQSTPGNQALDENCERRGKTALNERRAEQRETPFSALPPPNLSPQRTWVS